MYRWLVSSGAAVFLAGAALQAQTPASMATSSAGAAVARPIPGPVVPPPDFRDAISGGTRTATGRPGPRYWQNWTDYRLRTRVLPDTRTLEGSATIRYHNRSPDALPALVLDLSLNLHAPDAQRLEEVEVTEGVRIRRVVVDGTVASPERGGAARYQIRGTKMLVYLDSPLASGRSAELVIDWASAIPAAGAGGRMGHSQGNLVFLAYFYPQMAVYDDVVGWHLDPFLGPSEFYAGFGNYEVTIEAPAGWLVMGTGDLTNAADVLAAPVLSRLRQAEQSDTVVRVLTEADFGRATRPAPDGFLSWTFRADSVRDVAYSVTRQSIWDAARAQVGDRNGDGRPDHTRVDAIYRPRAIRWRNVVRYEQHSLKFLSQFTGLSYPWPHMTAVEGAGIIGGGMEYPMMTLIGDYTAADDAALYAVTVHELAHMWMPMVVASDERRYSWMDEGTTSFNENQARRDFFPGSDPNDSERSGYLRTAAAGAEGEIMRWSNFHYPGPAFTVASYYKPSLVLEALRGVLGEETFHRAYREFIRRWAYRHPYPWDMWNTFEEIAGRDLDWFWRSWYYETWLLDQAVASVTPSAQGAVVIIEDRGSVPMPVHLVARLASGQEVRREIPVSTWLTGARSTSITIPGDVRRVEIDPERRFPDADPSNNAWSR